MTEIALIHQPQWRIFQYDWVNLNDCRTLIYDAYSNEAKFSVVPESENLLDDDNLFHELYCRYINIMTFGEFVEQMNEEEEQLYQDNEEGYGEDIKHDIMALLAYDRLFFEDSLYGQLVNVPIVTIF